MHWSAGEDTVADSTPLRVEAPVQHGARLGRYIVLETLGTGGMGHVFAALDTVLDRKVALKVLRRTDDEERARLIREARAQAKLSHPNVVSVYDVGEADGRVFIAMELVEGSTLRQWLRVRQRSIGEIVAAFEQAALGLQAAHRAGIVHRDFKPDNVLIGHDGRVRVTDFGLAVPAEMANTLQSVTPGSASVGEGRLTETGCVMGTPAYMPIEQHFGLPTDVRSDQFSFCVALFEGLYRVRPFGGTTSRELCVAIRSTDLRTPRSSAVPWHVHDAVLRGLSPRPDERFESMGALMSALRPPARRRRGGWVLGLAGMAVGAASMVGVQFAAEEIVPRVLDRATITTQLGPVLEQQIMQQHVVARRASTAAECEAAFGANLGVRMLCLENAQRG